jgi:hypothetical protein
MCATAEQDMRSEREHAFTNPYGFVFGEEVRVRPSNSTLLPLNRRI